MFTGLVEARVQVRRVLPQGAGLRLQLARPGLEFDAARGDSIAVSGCCLTVASFAQVGDSPADSDFVFDLSAETLARTWFSERSEGRWVNLERSLRLGDRLGGHLVSGHVDGLAEVLSVTPTGDGGVRMVVEVEQGLERYMVHKGSIALDGVSLTVVEPEGRRCALALIPETLERTSLGRASRGDRLHVEADQIGKWIERLLAERG